MKVKGLESRPEVIGCVNGGEVFIHMGSVYLKTSHEFAVDIDDGSTTRFEDPNEEVLVVNAEVVIGGN